MTGRLRDMFGEIRLQNEEIGSILASIREGLCVLDGDARIVLANAAFRRISGSGAPEGRHFWEVVRSSAVSEVLRQVRETGVEAAAEATVGDRSYHCRVARLAAGDRIVVTLYDVTEFRAQ